MPEAKNILISVESRHAENLINGAKTVELRRRLIRVSVGGQVWIYSKMPTGCVVAVGIVDSIVKGNPKDMWEEYGHKSGITDCEFFDYFKDSDVTYIIVFKSVRPLSNKLTLKDIKNAVSNFHPPQFFLRLHDSNPVLNLLRSAAETA